jgi:hypothetical protein
MSQSGEATLPVFGPEPATGIEQKFRKMAFPKVEATSARFFLLDPFFADTTHVCVVAPYAAVVTAPFAPAACG